MKMNRPRILKVIATTFNSRSVRENALITGRPPIKTLLSQNFTDATSIHSMHDFLIKKELDSAEDSSLMDLLFVVSDMRFKADNQRLETKINVANSISDHRNFRFLERSNKGWSYGAFSESFFKYSEEYDYFFFCEDDVLILGDEKFRAAAEELDNDPQLGFLSFLGTSSYCHGLIEADAIHARNGIGMARTDRLVGAISEAGIDLLPFCVDPQGEYVNIIREGEVRFTNFLIKHGLSVRDFRPNKTLMISTYDAMLGRSFEKFPSRLELIGYHTKKIVKEGLYKFACSLGLR